MSREVLDTEIDLTDRHAARKDAVVTEGRIEFRDVCFQYAKDTDELVLDHINFTANPGRPSVSSVPREAERPHSSS